jgi:hypothetical protein
MSKGMFKTQLSMNILFCCTLNIRQNVQSDRARVKIFLVPFLGQYEDQSSLSAVVLTHSQSHLKKLFFGALRVRKQQEAADPSLARRRPATSVFAWDAIKDRMAEALKRERE